MLRTPLILFFILFTFSSSFLVSVESRHHKHHKHHHHHHSKQKGLNTFANSPRKSSPANPTDAFCKSFNKECYHQALHDKKGQIRLEIACERHGGKYSSKYAFACKADGQDLTQVVLNKIGAGYTMTVTDSSTVVVTGTVTDVETSTSTTTQEIDTTTTTDTSTTSTESTTNTDTVTSTIETTLTTVIPVTSTTTSFSTITTTTPFTTTIATSTFTSFILGTDSVPVVRVSLSPPSRRKRFNKVDSSQFCSAYTTGCQEQCARVQSTPKHVICESTGLYQYSLTCYCSNGKVETQHALAAAVDQEHISSVSTITTSTTYATVTSTSVVPTTVLSTSIATITSTVPVTDTYTSFTTATQTTTATGFTGLSVTLATTTPSVTITATATSTISATSTTTQIISAPTGAVQAFSQVDGSSQGYLQDLQDDQTLTFTSDITQADQFASVMDMETGYIQLQYTDGTGRVVYAEDLSDGSPEFEFLTWGQPSDCGTAGGKPGPADGSGSVYGAPCETFLFNPSTDSQTAIDGTISLLSEWYVGTSTSATQYTWVYYHNYGDGPIIEGTGNLDAFKQYDSNAFPLTIRYPYLV